MNQDEIESRIKGLLLGGFDIYRDGMRPFLIRMLRQVPGLTVEDAIRRALNGRALESFERTLSRGAPLEETIDIGEFPELIRHYWNQIFATHFFAYREVAHDTRQLRTIRNFLAHGRLNNLSIEAAVEHLGLVKRTLLSVNEAERVGQLQQNIEKLLELKDAVSAQVEGTSASEEVAPEEYPDDVDADASVSTSAPERSQAGTADKLSEGVHDFKVTWIEERTGPTGHPYFMMRFAHSVTREVVRRNYSLQPQAIHHLAMLMDEFGVDADGIEDACDDESIRQQVRKRLLGELRGKDAQLQLVKEEWNGQTIFRPERVMNPNPVTPS